MKNEVRGIRDLINQGEGIHLDFKHSINDAKKIARSLSAFANTDGGSLLIGVRDNGSIAGISSEEEYYMMETASLLYCKPPVKFNHKTWIIDGKTILEIIVAKSEDSPHYSPDQNNDYKAFIRVNDENFIAHKILVDVWKRGKSSTQGVKLVYDKNVELILKEISLNGSISKSQLTRITGIKSQKADRLLTNMMLMEILNYRISDNITEFVFHKNYNLEK